MPAAAPSARPTTAAATAATGRWRRRTPTRWPAGSRASAWSRATSAACSGPSMPMPERSGKRASVMATRSINVDYLARVEGEGGLHVTVRDGKLEQIQFSIFEPPRFFEAFMVGRAFNEAPDITARICGICPVAYQMSSVHAMENALGVKVGGQLRELRR